MTRSDGILEFMGFSQRVKALYAGRPPMTFGRQEHTPLTGLVARLEDAERDLFTGTDMGRKVALVEATTDLLMHIRSEPYWTDESDPRYGPAHDLNRDILAHYGIAEEELL